MVLFNVAQLNLKKSFSTYIIQRGLLRFDVLLAVTPGRKIETLFSFGLMSEKLTTGYPKLRSGRE